MVERLNHLGLLPDADQPSMTYEIKGHRYTAATDPSSGVRLIHNPPEDQNIGAGPAGHQISAHSSSRRRVEVFRFRSSWRAQPYSRSCWKRASCLVQTTQQPLRSMAERTIQNCWREDSLGSGGLGETPGIEPAEPAATILRSFGSNYVNCSSLSNGLSRAASGRTASAPGGSRLQRAAEASAWTSSVKSPSLRTRHKATKPITRRIASPRAAMAAGKSAWPSQRCRRQR
ncbi:hypothetical protein ACVI1L_005112 [Bradyrhizobium sp. USDA 4516]